MELKIAQVIGLNTDQEAAQVTSETQSQNSFFAVLDLSCDDAFTKGRLGLSELADFYFDTEGSPSEKLKATFSEASNKFAEGQFSFLIGAISGKVLYLMGKGEVEAYLKREQKLSPLLSVGAPAELISGFLNEGDKLLFATKSLVTFLGEDLEKFLIRSLTEFEEEVTARIGSSDLENQGLAALVVEMEKEPEQTVLEEVMPNLEDEPREKITKKPLALVLAFAANIKNLIVNYFPKSGRGRLILAILLIIIIVIGVGFKVKSSKDAQRDTEFNILVQQARDEFNGAKGIASLNPAEAKTKLDLAKDKINQALNLKSGDSEAQNLKKEIEEGSGSVLQESSVSDFPEFLDLDLVKKNFRANQISLSNGKLLLLDPGTKTLVLVDIAKKSNQILAGLEQLGDAQFASLNGDLAFIYSKDKGILRIDIPKEAVTTASKVDSDLGVVTDLYGFAGNIYLLDSTKQIWKYLPTASSYSDKREYLTEAVDLTNSIRMQIESSVYILKRGGEVLRFTKGEKDNFSLGGIPGSIKDPKSIFVSSDTEDLYLLDSGNSRLVILTKTGSFKSQITGDKFKTATDLVVDEEGKKVYLLDGGKIYTVELK